MFGPRRDRMSSNDETTSSNVTTTEYSWTRGQADSDTPEGAAAATTTTTTTAAAVEAEAATELDTITDSSIPSSPLSHFSDETLDLPPASEIPSIQDPLSRSQVFNTDYNRTPSPPPAYSEDETSGAIWHVPFSYLTQDHERNQRHFQTQSRNTSSTIPGQQTLTVQSRRNETQGHNQFSPMLGNAHGQSYGTIMQVNNYINNAPHASSSRRALTHRNRSNDLESLRPRSAQRVKTTPIALSVANGRAICKCCCCACTCSRAAVLITMFLVAAFVLLGLSIAQASGTHPKKDHDWPLHPHPTSTVLVTSTPTATPAPTVPPDADVPWKGLWRCLCRLWGLDCKDLF